MPPRTTISAKRIARRGSSSGPSSAIVKRFAWIRISPARTATSASCWLALGDYPRGWAGYEWRWQCDHSRARWREYPGKPRWDGRPLNGQTILLYPEQGYGDVIQFARFIPLVAARGGRVILESHPDLVD